MPEIKLNPGESAEVTNTSKQYKSGYFTRVGLAYPANLWRPYQMYQEENMDFVTTLRKIHKSTAAVWLLLECMERKDNLNQVVIKSSLLTQNERDKLKTGKKILIQEGIIKQVVKEVYILNPYLVLPPNASLEATREKWKSI